MFLLVSHVVYYTKWVIRKVKKTPEPLTDRQILERVDSRLAQLVIVIGDLVNEIREDRKKNNGKTTQIEQNPNFFPKIFSTFFRNLVSYTLAFTGLIDYNCVDF